MYRGAKRRLLGDLVRGAEQQGSVGQEGVPEGAGQAQRARQVQAQAHPSHGGLAYLWGGPAARTLDVVPSTEVWLLRLLCAVHDGDVVLAQGACRLPPCMPFLGSSFLRHCHPPGMHCALRNPVQEPCCIHFLACSPLPSMPAHCRRLGRAAAGHSGGGAAALPVLGAPGAL